MVVRLTQKARDKIKVKVPATESATPPPLFLTEWYANLIPIGRRSYFLFCEATTLFTVLKSSNRINDEVAFSRLATDVLFEQFKFNANLDIKLFEKLADSVLLLKTNNRQITGSMNDQAFFAQLQDDEGEGDEHLNRNRLSYLGYDSPREAFDKALASLDLGRY